MLGGLEALLEVMLDFQSVSLELSFLLVIISLSLDLERDLDLLYLLLGDGDLSYFLDDRLLKPSDSSLGLRGPLLLDSDSIILQTYTLTVQKRKFIT